MTEGWPPINRAGFLWGLLGWLEESLLTVGSEWGEVRQGGVLEGEASCHQGLEGRFDCC